MCLWERPWNTTNVKSFPPSFLFLPEYDALSIMYFCPFPGKTWIIAKNIFFHHSYCWELSLALTYPLISKNVLKLRRHRIVVSKNPKNVQFWNVTWHRLAQRPKSNADLRISPKTSRIIHCSLLLCLAHNIHQFIFLTKFPFLEHCVVYK